MRAPGRRALRAAAALLALAAAACADRDTPVAPVPPTPKGPLAPAITVQALKCTGSRTALTVSCEPVSPGGNGQGDIIVGNQNVYVKVTSTNVAYNGGTGQLTFDVTVQNLLEQPMGTLDGTTPAAGGIRIFFHSGPTVTSGAGVAAVLPDGFATFTAAGQPYYQYSSVLATGAVSPARTWTLIFPPTVTTFDFLLYVNAPVEYPNGYITLDGLLPEESYGYLHATATHPLVAVVKNAVGEVIPGQVVTFGTTDPGCATVDGVGVVAGVQYGTCSITATSGIRGGSLVFEVSGAVRTWTGALSTDWNVGGNWGLGRVPAVADSVVIPTGVPNFPVLTSAAAVSDITVADGATLDVAAFTLTSTGNVGTGPTAGSGIMASGAGQLVLGGAAKLVHGRFPRTLVTGTYTLDEAYTGVAPQMVDNGKIGSDGFNLMLTAQ